MIYIAIDPSGSFNEGKGHTGISIIKDCKWETLQTISIAAKNYTERHLYWNAVLNVIKKIIPLDQDITVIIESFVTRQNGFTIGKMPETSLLIGMLVWELEELNIKYVFQTPGQVKPRFRDDILGYYIPNYYSKATSRGCLYYLNDKLLNDHIRDSLKHLIYYIKYGGNK